MGNAVSFSGGESHLMFESEVSKIGAMIFQKATGVV